MERTEAESEITRLRDAIDRVDEVIVRLLNQRAKYAIEIGEVKAILGLPIPTHMEGKPLACLGVAPIPAPTHDPPVAAVPAPHQPQFDYTPEEQAIIEQRLADLGYLE